MAAEADLGQKGVLSMRRTTTGIMSAMVLVGSAFTMGASPAAADDLDTDRFQVSSRESTEHFNDVGRKGESLGDSFTFTSKLFHDGERVGRDAVRCDITRAKERSFGLQCFGTLTFRGRGDLTIHGKILFQRESETLPTLAITGGTGDYAGASGEFTLVETRRGPNRYRIHLMD